MTIVMFFLSPSFPISGRCDLALLDVDFVAPSPQPHQMANVLQTYYKEDQVRMRPARRTGAGAPGRAAACCLQACGGVYCMA